MKLVFSINIWLAFYPPSGEMNILLFWVGFIVASASHCYVLQSSAFAVHVHPLVSLVGLHHQWIFKSGVSLNLIKLGPCLLLRPLFG